jgi:ribonuclease-3
VTRGRKFADLEAALGYSFKGRELRTCALTHASVRSNTAGRTDNERLEFLGDRVLGLAIAEMLIEAFPSMAEGDLARRFNRLVNGATCASVARAIGLGAYLILSDSEAESGGREKGTILADAIEAVLGAVFVEAGFDAARAVVRKLWMERLAVLPDVSHDAKSALQEWAQGLGLSLPIYVEIERSGPDHAPRFRAEVRILGRKPAQGEGASKRAAEQSAAMALLAREGVWRSPADGG